MEQLSATDERGLRSGEDRLGIKDLILPRAGLAPVSGLLWGLLQPWPVREGRKVSQGLWGGRGGVRGAAVPPAGRLTRGAIPCTSPWPRTGAARVAFSPAGNSGRRRGSSLLSFFTAACKFYW